MVGLACLIENIACSRTVGLPQNVGRVDNELRGGCLWSISMHVGTDQSDPSPSPITLRLTPTV